MRIRKAAVLFRWILGGSLLFAGIGHLSAQRAEFQAQVPTWFPLNADLVVVVSGIVEILLGAALIALPRHQVVIGTIVAAFFHHLPRQLCSMARGNRCLRT
jgi:uncharacterized membrane protein